MTKRNFNREFLDECLSRDHATLIDEQNTTFTSRTMVDFICSCGKTHTKNFRSLSEYGALCEKCCKDQGYKKSSESHKQTRTRSSNTYVNTNFDSIISTSCLVGFIYLAKCNLDDSNGYVGLTQLAGGIEARRKTHEINSKQDSKLKGSCLYRAMRKYGCDSFTFEELERIDYSDQVKSLIENYGNNSEELMSQLKSLVDTFSSHLASREKYHADTRQTYTTSPSPGGYNVALAGDKPTLGVKHTPETCAKMIKAHESRTPRSEESKKKTSDSLKAFHKNATPEQAEMLRDKAKRVGDAQKGRPKKEETKRAISKTLSGRKDTPDILSRKIASHNEIGVSKEKYIRPHKWSGWIVYINNKLHGKFSKTFSTIEEAIAGRDAYLTGVIKPPEDVISVQNRSHD